MKYIFTVTTDCDFSFKINNKDGRYEEVFTVMVIHDSKNIKNLKRGVIQLVNSFSFYSDIENRKTAIETMEEYRKEFIDEVNRWNGEDYLDVSVCGNYGFTITPLEHDFDLTLFV